MLPSSQWGSSERPSWLQKERVTERERCASQINKRHSLHEYKVKQRVSLLFYMFICIWWGHVRHTSHFMLSGFTQSRLSFGHLHTNLSAYNQVQPFANYPNTIANISISNSEELRVFMCTCPSANAAQHSWYVVFLWQNLIYFFLWAALFLFESCHISSAKPTTYHRMNRFFPQYCFCFWSCQSIIDVFPQQ